ncbi:hypothetical protein [Palleronia caenipelagi]|nr:hypothetical protein [Palleronia caenipelagi]
MKDKVETVVEKPDAPKEPSRAQKREIILWLGEAYDAAKGCYVAGETDHTVAETLNVMPGWVVNIREEFFGPDGSNEDLAALKQDIAAQITAVEAFQKDLQARLLQIGSDLGGMKALRDRLAKIEQAVGPRVMKRVS